MTHIHDLWVTRKVLIIYRDLAMEHSNWEQVSFLSMSIMMMSELLEAGGQDLDYPPPDV